LHPGLQRILLNLMTSDRFPNQQYFLTTHSNHLLEITQDMEKISIYRFTKILTESKEPDIEAKFNIDSVSSGNRSLLDCLGVANSSVFLSNCTIWVEGITDRLYIRKYLELYNIAHKDAKKYSEDLQPYSAKYGAIKDKRTFAKKALGFLIDYNDLSDEAKQLTEKIYAFIKKNNT